jgi:hypothetical protein
MSDRDLFREVEDDLRREQIARLWDKYGVYVLAVAAFIVVFVASYNGYRWYQARQATETGAAFFRATEQVNDANYAEAQKGLETLTKDAPRGYRLLAKLELAALHIKEGRRSEAVALYDQVAADSGADAVLRDFARVQGAGLLLDQAEPGEISRRLKDLDSDSNPWRYSARELLALAAFRSGNTAESEKLFTKILSDPFAPAEMRKRAESMLALMVKAPQGAATQGAAATQ